MEVETLSCQTPYRELVPPAAHRLQAAQDDFERGLMQIRKLS